MYEKYTEALTVLNHSLWSMAPDELKDDKRRNFVAALMRDINARFAKIAEIQNRIERRQESMAQYDNADENEWAAVSHMLESGGVHVSDAMLDDAFEYVEQKELKSMSRKKRLSKIQTKKQALYQVFDNSNGRFDLVWLATVLYNIDNKNTSKDFDYTAALKSNAAPSVLLKMLASRPKSELMQISENLLMIELNDQAVVDAWRLEYEEIRKEADSLITEMNGMENTKFGAAVQAGKDLQPRLSNLRNKIGDHYSKLVSSSFAGNNDMFFGSTLMHTDPATRGILALFNAYNETKLFDGKKENYGIYNDVPYECYHITSDKWTSEIKATIRNDPFAKQVFDFVNANQDMTEVAKIECIWHAIDTATKLAVHLFGVALALDADTGSAERDSPIKDIVAETLKAENLNSDQQKVRDALVYYSATEYVSPDDCKQLVDLLKPDATGVSYDNLVKLLCTTTPRKRELYTKALGAVFGKDSISKLLQGKAGKTAGVDDIHTFANSRLRNVNVQTAIERGLESMAKQKNTTDRFYLVMGMKALFFAFKAIPGKTGLYAASTYKVGVPTELSSKPTRVTPNTSRVFLGAP